MTIASSFKSISTLLNPILLDLWNSWWLFKSAKFPSLYAGLSLYNFFPCEPFLQFCHFHHAILNFVDARLMNPCLNWHESYHTLGMKLLRIELKKQYISKHINKQINK